MINNIMAFWNGFSIDLLIGIISCILGVIALIVGGIAYHDCKINNNKTTNKKKIAKGADDHSYNASGDMYILQNDGKSLVDLNSNDFSVALNKAYEMFSTQCENNLKQITREAQRIVNEKKIELGSYTKLDWINIYFESARNSSDTFMQNVWAKVLVQELSKPDSFSYKTLDVLKNMSAKDFKLFEKMCQLVFLKEIDDEKICKQFNFSWLDQSRMKELGLLNMELSSRPLKINKQNSIMFPFGKSLVMCLGNSTTSEMTIELSCHIITMAAEELLTVASFEDSLPIAEAYMKKIKNENSNCFITLHHLYGIINGKYNYDHHPIIGM